jgi:hypothetical protein
MEVELQEEHSFLFQGIESSSNKSRLGASEKVSQLELGWAGLRYEKTQTA